jgi:integrase
MATIARIARQGGTVYKAIVKRDGRILKTKTFARKTDAKDWARRLEADRQRLEALGSPGASLTFAQLATEYLANYAGRSVSRPAEVRWWTERLGSQRLIDISTDAIRQALDAFAQGKARRAGKRTVTGCVVVETARQRAPATVNRRKACLSAVLKFANQRGYLNDNPARRIAARPEHNRRERFLSPEERRQLLDACRSAPWPRLYLFALLALTTGCRRGELEGLDWQDIDFPRRTFRLRRTKNGDARIVPFPTVAAEELLKFREREGLVFEGRAIETPWRRALKAAGIENLRIHDLRHDAASSLINAGTDLYTVGQILGHRSMQTTARYAHLAIAKKQAVVDAVMDNLPGVAISVVSPSPA